MTARFFRLPAWLALLTAIVFTQQSNAVETTTYPTFGLRLSKAVDNASTIESTFSVRGVEDFQKHDIDTAEVRYDKRLGSNDFMVGYHLEIDRNNLKGNEHRFMQQFRHQFALPHSSIDSSLRLEERYFDYNSTHGTRLRWQTRWNLPLTTADTFHIGYENVYNNNDISASTQRGESQDRYSGSIQHNLRNGNKLEFEFLSYYVHNPGKPYTLQNHVRLTYTLSFK